MEVISGTSFIKDPKNVCDILKTNNYIPKLSAFEFSKEEASDADEIINELKAFCEENDLDFKINFPNGEDGLKKDSYFISDGSYTIAILRGPIGEDIFQILFIKGEC